LLLLPQPQPFSLPLPKRLPAQIKRRRGFVQAGKREGQADFLAMPEIILC